MDSSQLTEEAIHEVQIVQSTSLGTLNQADPALTELCAVVRHPAVTTCVFAGLVECRPDKRSLDLLSSRGMQFRSFSMARTIPLRSYDPHLMATCSKFTDHRT